MRRPLLHLLHALVPVALLGTHGLPRALGAVLLFVSVFGLAHDAMHRVLGLPRGLNEVVLTLASALMGTSGTAARTLHLVHHARPGAADDLEGRALRLSVPRAVLTAPLAWLAMPLVAWRGLRVRQLVEWALAAAFVAVSLRAGGALRAYAIACIVAQSTITLWAGLLPHRAPPALLALARRLAWTRSPLVLSFAFHDEHHAAAGTSVFDLGLRARAHGTRVEA